MHQAHRPHTRLRAFSLLELIGVLTVVGILASLLIPRVFNAIHNAAITQTATSLNSLRTACVDHYAKFGCFATDGSVNPPAFIPLDGTDSRSSQFDKVLLWETLLDGLFSPKIGDRLLGSTNTRVQIVAALPASTQPDENNAAYSLDGSGVNQANGTVVVEAIITGVAPEDAKALNDLIDGVSLGQDANGNDFVGRVKYGNASNSSGNGNSNGSGNGNSNGNGNGLGSGNGNGGNNNGNGNGGTDSGNGNGGNNSGNGNGNGNSNGNGNGSGSSNTGQSANSSTVHIYLTHH